MLCASGMGRMAAMERLLATGNFSEISQEEANREKLAAKAIYKELKDADEANLLEEADMHVFDSKPMTDLLQLVCCNACKKPVKASQYAAHAERCGALISMDDTGLELDGGSGHKKPPRKGRKKVHVSQDNQAATNLEQERSEPLEGDDTAASETANMDDMHTGIVTSLSRELKRSSPSIDGTIVGDGSGVSLQMHSGGVISPLKRAKAPSESMPLSNGLERQNGTTAETGTCCQGMLTCKMHSSSSRRSTIGGINQPYDAAIRCQNSRTAFESTATADGPAPLATKVYRFQRNQELRAVLGKLYFETVAKEHRSDSLSPSVLESNGRPSPQVSPPSNLFNKTSNEGMNQKKKDAVTLPVVRKPDQILAQSSESCLGIGGAYPSMMNLTNQSPNNNFVRPTLAVENGSMGMMRKGYLAHSYSYPVNSGGPVLRNMQQPNGIVPAV